MDKDWASTQAQRYRWRRWIFRDVLLRYLGLTLVVKLHVQGAHHIPIDGPTILMMNHHITIDGVLPVAYIRHRTVIPVVKIENFHHPILGFFVRHWGTVGIQRGEIDRVALKVILDLLGDGQLILIAPEGTRQATLTHPKDGLAYVAIKSGAVVVPTAIWNGESWAKDFLMPRRTHIQMHFGRPFVLRAAHQRVRRADLGPITTEMMYQLAQLLPPNYRGVYQDVSQMTTQHLEFLPVPIQDGGRPST